MRLTRLYGEMSDEELQHLAAGFSDLTEFAQPILRDEMRKRGLADPQPAKQAAAPNAKPVFGRWNQAVVEQNRALDSPSDDSVEDDDAELPHEYTWKTLLCDCDSGEQAWQISEVLKRHGIESWIEGPRGELDVTGPRVIVAADQLEEAKQILAQPIPQDIIDQSKVKVEDFVPPTCPKCGASDPLLESVEPTNTWLCENCGAQWADSAAFHESTFETAP